MFKQDKQMTNTCRYQGEQNPDDTRCTKAHRAFEA
jgi:hypothetical protein